MGIPIVQYLWTMLHESKEVRQLIAKMLFLLAMVIVSFVVMSVRKRTRACLVLLPVCALSFWAGCMLDLYSFDPGDLIRLLYASPLIVIAVGCVLQLIHSHRLTHMSLLSSIKPMRPRLRPWKWEGSISMISCIRNR